MIPHVRRHPEKVVVSFAVTLAAVRHAAAQYDAVARMDRFEWQQIPRCVARRMVEDLVAVIDDFKVSARPGIELILRRVYSIQVVSSGGGSSWWMAPAPFLQAAADPQAENLSCVRSSGVSSPSLGKNKGEPIRRLKEAPVCLCLFVGLFAFLGI